MRRKLAYIFSLLILVLLVCGAFCAPSLMLRLNDKRLLESYRFGNRSGVDYRADTYISDRAQRLRSFAEGLSAGKQYYIISSGEEPEDWDAFLKEFISNAFFTYINSYGFVYARGREWREFYDSSHITAWDHYVIYDSDMGSGAAFLCWYVEISSDLGPLIRMLVDASDGTVYYLESYYDGVVGVVEDRVEQLRKSVFLYDPLYLFFLEYYGADVNDLIYMFNGRAENVAESLDSLYGITKVNPYGAKENGVYRAEEDELSLLLQWAADGLLPYENSALHMDFYMLEAKDGYSGAGIGVRELRDLLPADRRGSVALDFNWEGDIR